ncbi:formyltransferase family protein [Flavobacteriaceae bacterium]|nr:formyltransferase family protein [Flavobacteriaceae bacterium]|tara:strand:- start:1114 stop:1875 length:762 start_codon:yes stop_codon:yes gene_type:complete
MRIIIITQDEPFYLKTNLKYLISILPSDHEIVGCVVNTVSPFGKKESFYDKAIKTLNVFGFQFFMYYSFKFIFSKIFTKSIKTFLEENNITNIKLNNSVNSKDSLKIIKSFEPDLLVSILGNQIFKRDLLDLAPKGCINLHTALLPKYRGLMPTFWVLKNNEKYTGVSVFFVDEGIDSGPIIVQEKVEIGNLSQAQLITRTKKIGMELIVKAIKLISKNNLILIPNPEIEKTYYSFPTRNDVIEFNKNGKKFF